MAKTLRNLHWVYPVANAIASSYVSAFDKGVPLTTLEGAYGDKHYICAPLSGKITKIEDNDLWEGLSNIEIDTYPEDGSTISNFFIGINLAAIQADPVAALRVGKDVVQGQWVGDPVIKQDLASAWDMIPASVIAEGLVFAAASTIFAPEMIAWEAASWAARLYWLTTTSAAFDAASVAAMVLASGATEYAFTDDTPLPYWQTWVRGPGEKLGAYVHGIPVAQQLGRGIDVLGKSYDTDKTPRVTLIAEEKTVVNDPTSGEWRDGGAEKAEANLQAFKKKKAAEAKNKGMLMLAAAAAAYFYFKGK